MVRPICGVGVVFQWFAQRAWRGFVFQWSAQRAWRGFVFQWFAQRARGVSFFNGSPNAPGGVSFFNGSPNVSDFDMWRHANPLNSHTARAPCYMCYMCYMGLTRQPAEPPLSFSSLLYVLYVLYGSYTPTSRAVYYTHSISTCTKYALYRKYSTDFARTEYIAHIVHIARSWGRVGVQRVAL